jgi:tetratricopeptide (TPR) repeat protein
MSNKTDDNLFMISSLTRKYAGGFYQELLKGIGSYEQLGKRLIYLGEQAHAFRQFNKVQEIGQLLSNIPIKDYQAIGYYFLAVAVNNKGNGDQDKARQLYERAAETAPAHYQSKSLLSLAAVAANTNKRDLEMYYYLETIKAGKMSVAALEAFRGVAIYKAMEGYHDRAIKDLEAIMPIIKFAPPHIYYAYLNSYATELGEVGRKSEARNISRIVLASPFATAYPEWQETGRELGIIGSKNLARMSR